MGCCEEPRPTEVGEDKNNKYHAKNICIRILTGHLRNSSDFKDSIIYNQQELDEKLRVFIPTKIKNEETNNMDYNTKDDILTNSLVINFDDECLIVVNGVNRIFKVEENQGNYMIFHDELPGSYDKYTALIVKKLGPLSEIRYATPKFIPLY